MSAQPTDKPARLFLSPPHQSGREMEFLAATLESNYIAPLGPMVDAFERELAEYTGMPHVVALSSGTAALHLAMRGLGVGPGDIVLASTLTFLGGVSPIEFVGATPVFIDCDPAHWTIDVGLVEEELKSLARAGRRAKALIACDIYGQSCDLDPLIAVCAAHGVALVSDAAEALGTRYRERHAGVGSAAAAFSFNGNKIITTGGGGALASHDKALIDHARFLSQQARDPAPHYQHSQLGYNYRMSSLAAAVGRAQLAVLDERVARRRAIFAEYRRLLGGLPGIGFMPEASYGRMTNWLTVITIDPRSAGGDREAVRLALEAENIEARPLWKPMHLQPLFSGAARRGGAVSEALFEGGLCLPSGSQMTDADVARVADVVARTLRAR
ncbi:MAG TPA: aminotransferase class I/II-fold pyridoxal phosphate-dependent enzyme [Alphaproteobacteria bacterium]|nr:aminotransferase class I/II-fold pyridoxal phosphate-dependent enzyme [Alphaproteobacteria bacterium]